MRLLIVDDNWTLAEITAELLRWEDRRANRIETIEIAGDLETAKRLLPQNHAVLCDGQFPRFPDSGFVAEEWNGVFLEACRFGVRFVLYSGSAECLDDARECDIPAVSKPASIEKLYALLTQHDTRDGQQPSLTSQVVSR